MPCKAGCGVCCVAIRLGGTSPAEFDAEKAAHEAGEGRMHAGPDWDHVLTHFHRISREEAVRLNPHLKGRPNKGASFYTCDWYDLEDKRCMHHPDRPPLCRNYPFYGDRLSEGEMFYTPDCGYVQDVGKTQEEAEGARVVEMVEQGGRGA